jgi:hypothetical protein
MRLKTWSDRFLQLALSSQKLSMNITNDVTLPDASPITSFVITLGKQLLQGKVKDWLDMDGVARFCRDHAIQLNGKQPGSMELETALRSLFQSSGEFYGPGVNVDGYERPKGWDPVFMIRAYPYSSRQHSTSAHLAELDFAAPVTACSD